VTAQGEYSVNSVSLPPPLPYYLFWHCILATKVLVPSLLRWAQSSVEYLLGMTLNDFAPIIWQQSRIILLIAYYIALTDLRWS
jgi:hypothetical protein